MNLAPDGSSERSKRENLALLHTTIDECPGGGFPVVGVGCSWLHSGY